MKRFSTAMTGAAIATAFALSATAAHAADSVFIAADTNGDGALTMEEVSIAMPQATEEAFITADIDRNGTLSEDEFVAALNDGVLPTNS